MVVHLYQADMLNAHFRWKGENVSTNEVANAMTEVPWIKDANVYGVSVPGKKYEYGGMRLHIWSILISANS